MIPERDTSEVLRKFKAAPELPLSICNEDPFRQANSITFVCREITRGRWVRKHTDGIEISSSALGRLVMAAREMGHVDPIIIPKGNGPATDTTNTSTDDATSTRDTDILHQYLDAPPSLEYSVASRKWKIIFFWTVVTFDSVAMPIALYFALWYGTDLSPNAVFSIVTAAIGGISIWEYAARLWALWKKDSTCRPIGAERKHVGRAVPWCILNLR